MFRLYALFHIFTKGTSFIIKEPFPWNLSQKKKKHFKNILDIFSNLFQVDIETEVDPRYIDPDVVGRIQDKREFKDTEQEFEAESWVVSLLGNGA